MKRIGVKSTATVLQLFGNSYKGMNTVLIQYPLMETGESITKEIIVAGLPYQPGDKLPMYYDRHDPGNMVLDGGKSFVFFIIFTAIIAIGSIAAAYMINKAVAEGSM